MSKIRPNNFDAGAAAAARAAAGLTQQQVADAVGKTKALVQHWEAGRRQPYPEITRALADLYGVDVEDLLVSPLELAMADMATVRRAQRISVDEMAERIGVSTRSIEQVEAGARMPDDPIAWAAGYKVSLPALATAWRNTPAPIAESLEPVGGRRIEPGPTSPVTTALATAYDAEPERLQVSAPDLDHDDLGMVRRRARISGEQMAMRVMAPGDPAPKLRELYRVEAASYLPPDPVRWARAYGLSVRGLAACWRRGWIGPHGGAGKHTVDLRDGDDRPTGRPGRG
jgi:transcriptional regulator with XRE-family HTH domain